MLKPLARFSLRHAIQIQDFLEAAKVAFIEAAIEEVKRKGEEKVNVSRLSAMTGLHRRDVMRIYEAGDIQQEERGLTARVIGQWLYDPKFCKRKGTARPLTHEGEYSEFKELVYSISRDLNPATVLFELERLEVVKRRGKNLILVRQVYMPRANYNDAINFLSKDITDLVNCIEHNVNHSHKVELLHLHGRTEFDRIAASKIPEIRNWLRVQGSAFHKRARDYLSKFDYDLNKKLKSGDSVAKVSLGTFSYIDEE